MAEDFPTIDVVSAQADLERLVTELQSGKTKGFIITEDGEPAVLMEPIDQ